MANNNSKAIKIENEQVENVRAKAYIENDLKNTEQKDNENKKNNVIKAIEVAKEENLAKEEKIENIIIKKEKKRTGTVILVSKLSIIVEDENGNGYTLFNHPEAKYGDVIEF